MTSHFTAGITALALILAPLAAQADHKSGHGGGGNDNGRGNDSQSDRGAGNGVTHARDVDDGTGDGTEEVEEAVTGGHPCASGLAGRDTPCVPPGQARQGVTTEQWIGAPTEGYAAGDDISDESYGLIVNTDQLGLDIRALQAGQSYALVGDTIVVVDDSGVIVSVVRRAAIPGRSNG